MSKRAAAVEETRRRIVEATMELHTAQGILATSWEEIAERAGVAPATVYRHFPGLDELLPACGARSVALLELPDDARITELFDGVAERRDRIDVLVGELAGIYERGEGVLRSIERDRSSLAQLQRAHEQVDERLTALIEAALKPSRPTRAVADAVRALCDFRVWRSLRERGLDRDAAAETMASVVDAWLRTR